MADLLDCNYESVPHALSDDSLRARSGELKLEYVNKYSSEAKSLEKAVETVTKKVNDLENTPVRCSNQSWWVLTLVQAARINKIDLLIFRLKEDVPNSYSKKNPTSSLVNK